VNSAGLIESVANNVPRLDYTNGSCPSILVEPQRTNLVFPSDIATTQTRTVTAVAHTLSFYGTGTVVLSGVAIATLSGTGANNKVSLTFTPSAGSLILTVTGSVTDWQLEAGSNATSYIPTEATTVTRNADVISKTGISDLIGQTEGTMFVDFNLNNLLGNVNRRILCISNNNSASENIQITFTSALTNTIRAVVATGGSFPLITSSQITNLGKIKIAVAYNTTDVVLYINGVKQGTDLGSVSKPVLKISA
jgi:hypothetical protein